MIGNRDLGLNLVIVLTSLCLFQLQNIDVYLVVRIKSFGKQTSWHIFI